MRKGSASGKSGRGKIVRVTMTPERTSKALRSIDWQRITAMTDEEIVAFKARVRFNPSMFIFVD